MFAFFASVSQSQTPNLQALTEFFEKGIDAYENQKPEEATHYLELFVNHSELIEEKAQAHVLLAQMRKKDGRGLEAAHEFMKALGIYRHLKLEVPMARQYVNLANLFRDQLSQYHLAIKHYKIAEELFEKLGESSAFWSTHIDHINTLLDMGKTEESLVKLMNTSARLDPIRQQENWLRSRFILAKTYYRKGDFAQSLRLVSELQSALLLEKEAVKENPRLRLLDIDTQNLKGLLEGESGLVTEALKTFRSLIKLCEEIDQKSKLPIIYNNLGYWLRLSGEPSLARAEHHRALRMDLASGRRLDQGVAFDLRNLGFTWLADKDTSEAVPLLHEAYDMSQKLSMPFNAAHSALGLAESMMQENRFSEALAYFQSSYDLAVSTHSDQLKWVTLAGLGHAAMAQGYVRESYAYYQKSYDLVTQILENLETQKSKEALRSQKRYEELMTGLELAHATVKPESPHVMPQ